MKNREFVERYLQRGWDVVPLAPGQKACKDSDWQKIRFKVNDFEKDDNVGIKSINGIVIVDEDAPEVVVLADFFLPGTGAIYGRKSKPKSKRIYKSKFAKLIAYKDQSGDTLVEIRVNHQDMAPPSIHPSGEELEWYNDKDPTDIHDGILKKAVQCLATAALIVRNYNAPGARHEWTLALAGTLRAIGLNEKEATHIIKHAAAAAGDAKIQDRLTEINSTYSKGDDEPIAKGKTLSELSKKGFVKALYKIWGISSDSAVPEWWLRDMNEKHAVVFQQSGSLVVLTFREGESLPRFSSLETIRQLYPQLIPVGTSRSGTPIFKKWGAAWIDHPNRLQYSGIELNSNGTTTDFYNLWRGFSVKPMKGDWSLYKEHLDSIVADGSATLARWILQWMAAAVQKPTEHAHTAIVLRGDQGCGKSTFCEWFGALFGPHFLELSSYNQFVGRFNSHLHNAILVFGDEAIWPGNKSGIGNLRRMVTQNTLSIERKGLDIITVPNHVHLMMASNADWVVSAHKNERRFATFDLSNVHQGDHAFFGAVHKQLFEENGLSALLYDLLECKITENLRIIPHTAALAEQKTLSAEFMVRWYQDLLEDRKLLWDKEYNEYYFFKEKDVVYSDYLDTRKSVGERDIAVHPNMFWKKMKELIPGLRQKRFRKPERRVVLIPTHEQCRSDFEKQYGEQQWSEIDDETGEKPESDMPF